jgi:hypothetical protein
MNKYISGTILMVFICLPLFGDTALALRCRGKVIDVGTPKPEVLAHCGEPSWVEERQEERLIRNCRSRSYREDLGWKDREYYRRRHRPDGPHDACVIHVTIEEWFYNFGSSRFTQTLLFEDNRLVDIIEGDYGY